MAEELLEFTEQTVSTDQWLHPADVVEILNTARHRGFNDWAWTEIREDVWFAWPLSGITQRYNVSLSMFEATVIAQALRKPG